MIALVASEEPFVREVLINAGGAPSQFLRFAIMADEYAKLLSEIGSASSTAARLLTGLLRTKSIIGVSPAEMTKGITANLETGRPEHVELALMCGRHFVHYTNLTERDLAEFGRFGILTHSHNNIQYEKIFEKRTTNVVRTWSLVDGGNECLSGHALEYLNYISHVKIYDRYFGRAALDALKELFSAHSSLFGVFNGRITIYFGRQLCDNLVKNDVFAALSAHVNVATLNVLACDKVSRSNLHVHDRVMQLDNDYTVEFTAGINSYYENSGKNRAGSVHLRSVLSDYAEFELKDETGSIVKFRF